MVGAALHLVLARGHPQATPQVGVVDPVADVGTEHRPAHDVLEVGGPGHVGAVPQDPAVEEAEVDLSQSTRDDLTLARLGEERRRPRRLPGAQVLAVALGRGGQWAGIVDRQGMQGVAVGKHLATLDSGVAATSLSGPSATAAPCDGGHVQSCLTAWETGVN